MDIRETRQLKKNEYWKLYGWTLSYFKPFIAMTSLYILAGGVMILGETYIPRRIGHLIDGVLPKGQMSLLIAELGILLGIVLIILGSKSIFTYLEMSLATKIMKNQQKQLLEHLQTLGLAYYERVPTGQILALFENAVKETQKTYTFLVPQLVYAFVQFTVPSLILIVYAPLFFVAAMVGNILYVALNQVATREIERHLAEETTAAQASQKMIYDTISGVEELKLHGRGDWMIEQSKAAFTAFTIPRMKSIIWRHIRFTTVGLTLTLSIGLFYVIGLQMVRSGQLTLGTLIGYSFLMGLVSRGFSVFFYIIPAQVHALHYAQQLQAFLALQPEGAFVPSFHNTNETHETDEKAAPTNIAFELQQVSFGYKRESLVLDKVSLSIPIGKKTAFVGESGCGKSTLLKLIGGFYQPTEGKILYHNRPLSTLDESTFREQVSLVFQENYLFQLSIKDNIRFGRLTATDQEITHAAQQAKAHEFILQLPEGYDTELGERGHTLSGGQRQRLAVARALIRNPEVLILDEATSALDLMTEQALKETLEEVTVGKTVIAVAHRLSTIEAYDQIVVLDKGRLAEIGTYDELLAKRGLFYQLVQRGTAHEA